MIDKKIKDLKKRIFSFQNPPLVMGILNLTPDSFYDGGKYATIDKALKKVEQMMEEGADIIDIGGESSRPGSSPVPLDEELKRVLPVLEETFKRFPDVYVSIDTYKSKVAEESILRGAVMVNDISAFRFDEKMVEIVKKYNVLAVLMHMKGTPRDMQRNPYYKDTIGEIYNFLEERKKYALDKGVLENNLIFDPGIGFGKRLVDNLLIFKHLDVFTSLGPVLVGPSRKSFIGFILDLPPEERLEGTIASVSIAVFKGARIIRVHDVKENKRAIKVAWEIHKAKQS